MGLRNLMAKGEIELIEHGGGRRKSNTYFISIFNQPIVVSDKYPAGNAGSYGPPNPAKPARNPAVSSPNRAKFAPKRKERNERTFDLREDHGGTANGTKSIDELMIELVGTGWNPWASKIATIIIKESTAHVVVEGEYALAFISQNYGDALLLALKQANDDLEGVRIKNIVWRTGGSESPKAAAAR